MSDDDIIIPEPNIETDDESHRALNNLRIEIESGPDLGYTESLEMEATKEGIKVAAINESDFEQEEGILEQERILGIKSIAKASHMYHLQLLSKEQKARKKLQKQYFKQQRKYFHLKDNSAHNHQLQQVAVSKALRRKEIEIRTLMRKKNTDLDVTIEKGENSVLYGGINRKYKVS